ncbi:hypothetical protein PR048_024977 [Dryococelus australis]|uniref:Dirigent protein n=1 Tax=Dryococelus australis TaxID=614101 RepID=A0ABQ9GQ18_9NEOP|nr:hypothetical protein PR048_024977 [Dryococelus australis]
MEQWKKRENPEKTLRHSSGAIRTCENGATPSLWLCEIDPGSGSESNPGRLCARPVRCPPDSTTFPMIYRPAPFCLSRSGHNQREPIPDSTPFHQSPGQINQYNFAAPPLLSDAGVWNLWSRVYLRCRAPLVFIMHNVMLTPVNTGRLTQIAAPGDGGVGDHKHGAAGRGEGRSVCQKLFPRHHGFCRSLVRFAMTMVISSPASLSSGTRILSAYSDAFCVESAATSNMNELIIATAGNEQLLTGQGSFQMKSGFHDGELFVRAEVTVVSLLASHQNEPGSILGRVTGFSQVGIVPDDPVGRWVFSGISRLPRPLIPAQFHPHRLSRPRYESVAAAECKGEENGRSPKKNPPTGTIPTCENPGADPAGNRTRVA